MSLYGIRNERKAGAPGPTSPPALWKLVAMLAIVLYMIWWLAHQT